MKFFVTGFLLVLFTWQSSLGAKKSLQDDIADGYLDDYSKIEAAFILSGITDPDSLPRYMTWYDNLLNKIQSFPYDYDNPVESAKTVFMYLHSSWLKTYALESTTLADIVRSKEYNCVAATILYNLVCEDLNWSCEAFETPTHVYTIFNNFRQKVIVENTSTMGFDIMNNLQAYSRYLAQYYPESEVLKIGLDRLYYHENSNGRTITNTELLGLLAYNRAYLAKKNSDFEAAYDFVLLAQQFNRDSRSNVRFEIGLYYAWGKQLFDQHKFIEAFGVIADGYYRYSENDDFKKNTILAFFSALQMTWDKKDWFETARLIREITDLEILQKNHFDKLKQILMNWLNYFNSLNEGRSYKEAEQILKELEK